MSWRKAKNKGRELYPDEVFLDSANLSGLDTNQMEGKIEKPISERTIFYMGLFFLLIFFIFISNLWIIQIVMGDEYKEASENNRFQYLPLIAERGVIYSSDDVKLAWNTFEGEFSHDNPSRRFYTDIPGFAHILGYIKPPMKDSSGFYFQYDYQGISGVEKEFNEHLNGENGLVFIERNAVGEILSRSVINTPERGDNLYLSINSEFQKALSDALAMTIEASNFRGGTGVLMDIHTGEILSSVSLPEYSSQLLSDGSDEEEINKTLSQEDHPFLNRISGGVFIPGSVMKLFVAAGVLEEGLIDPNKVLDTPYSISVPNPYNPSNPTIFRDWREHGSADMRKALAISSNVYFYKVGGGFEGVEGLGISRIDDYMRRFGFEEKTGIETEDEKVGLIPNPKWKQRIFADGVWRLGDTYNTAIGQYGFQTTLIQVARATASIANGGYLIRPTLLESSQGSEYEREVEVSEGSLDIIKEGMRQAVTDGTAEGLYFPDLDIAAKTGTAQTGPGNQYINSWITGFFPYDEPKYVFTILLENGPSGTMQGGVFTARMFINNIKDEIMNTLP